MPEGEHIEQTAAYGIEVYRLLAENISDVIWILDRECVCFRYISPGVRHLLGYTAEEVMAEGFGMAITTDTLQDLLGKFPARMEAFEQGQRIRYVDQISQRRKDGSIVWVEVTTTIHRNAANGHIEIYGVSRDITERKRNEALLHLRLELLYLAPEVSLGSFMQTALDRIAAFTESAIGFYHFVEADQKTLSLQAWSTGTLTEFCQTEGQGLHYCLDDAGVWVDCVRQRKPVIHNDYASLPHRKGLPEGHAPLVRELVVPVYRGELLVAILGVGNKPTDYNETDVETVSYLADLVWEVSQRKLAEQNLSEIQARLNLLSQNLVEAGLYVYAHDPQGKPHFEYLSAGMEALTGVKIEDALRDPRAIHAQILPEYFRRLAELEERSKHDLLAFQMEILQKHATTGEVRWMLLRSTPRRREDGSTVWYGMQLDITERKQNEHLLEAANVQLRCHMQEIEALQETLREQSLRDPLTGLYNRRYLAETLAREAARADRENKPLSIIISDVDDFKRINDTYGHSTGDHFLIEIAALINRSARKSDIVCRYGGEEFLLVLPGTTLENAIKRADEIRQKCAGLTLPENAAAGQISMSFGVATYPIHGLRAEEVISKADRALYISKNTGRNKVTAWDATR